MTKKKKPKDDRANKEMPYFMIRWARKPSWTLKEAACLSCGLDPEDEGLPVISLEAENQVSRQFGWLLNKAKKGVIQSIGMKGNDELFHCGTIIRACQESKPHPRDFHPLMAIALNHMYQAPAGISAHDKVDRPVYRRAGEVIKDKHPELRLNAIAKSLEALPVYYNKGNYGHISQREASTIIGYLKGLPSPLRGFLRHTLAFRSSCTSCPSCRGFSMRWSSRPSRS